MNKFAWILLLTAVILTSGCFDKGNGTNTTVKPDLIPQTNLPSGFTYMGMHETPVNVGESKINATEGVYRYNKEDVYIQVIESEKPDALIAQYKLAYKNAMYNPFEVISLNGHSATLVKDYSTINGQQIAYYTVIWANSNAMIIVGSSTSSNAVIALATATGS